MREKKNDSVFSYGIAKAPEAVVKENRRRLTEEESRLFGLQAALNRLDADM